MTDLEERLFCECGIELVIRRLDRLRLVHVRTPNPIHEPVIAALRSAHRSEDTGGQSKASNIRTRA